MTRGYTDVAGPAWPSAIGALAARRQRFSSRQRCEYRDETGETDRATLAGQRNLSIGRLGTTQVAHGWISGDRAGSNGTDWDGEWQHKTHCTVRKLPSRPVKTLNKLATIPANGKASQALKGV